MGSRRHTRVVKPANKPIYRAGGRRRAKPSVLIVEDDPCIRRLLREVLELEGYPIYGAAEHGIEGLVLLRFSQQPLVVVTGHIMPVMTGLDMLEEVARDPKLAARHRYVMATAAVNLVHGAAVLDELDAAFVPKPFTVEQLLDAVERAARGVVR